MAAVALQGEGGANPGAEDALEKLEQSRGARDAEGAARAVHDLIYNCPLPSQLETADGVVSAMARQARAANEQVPLGHLLVATAEILVAQEKAQAALDAATEALDVFRAAQHGKGMATALEALYQAHSAQHNTGAGIRALEKEAEAAKSGGDRSVEACVLEAVARAQGMAGDPQKAVEAGERAADAYRGVGNKEGEGSALHLVAEMRWALGELAEATEVARQSLAAFTAAKCSWGEEQAKTTISSLFAQRGQIEQAPNRPGAIRALRELARAVQQRDMTAARAAEETLNSRRDLVTDLEIVENLQPLMEKDPGAKQFLKDLGWNFGEREPYPGSYIKQYSHNAFYLHTVMTGMGFGPQFRSVNPWRKGREPTDYHALTVSQLPETEAWQMELGFRPGIIDSTFQSLGVVGFP